MVEDARVDASAPAALVVSLAGGAVRVGGTRVGRAESFVGMRGAWALAVRIGTVGEGVVASVSLGAV